MEQKLKLGGLMLALSLLSACASRPPAERVVPPPAEQAPAQRPLPPPVRSAEPAASPAPAAPATPLELPGSDGQSAAPRAAMPSLPPAAKSLIAKADRASAAGRHDQAAAYIERALRIAPQHPVLWQNLAVVRYRQRDYGQAEELALKSNALAAGAPALRRSNWELIATVRRLKGDLRGAAAAAGEAQRLAAAAR